MRKTSICLIWLLAASFSIATAQVQQPHSIDDVLQVTKVKDILQSIPEQFLITFQQHQTDSSLASQDLSQLAAKHFADTTLYRYVLEGMQKRSDKETLTVLTAWLFSDWAIEARGRVETYEPEQTLEEYAQGLQEAPPAQERVLLMARFVEANSAGSFYVGLQEAVRVAVDEVMTALGGASEEVPSLTEQEKAGMVQQYTMFALVSFLHRYEPLSDAQLTQLVEAYESESGRWYVEAYSRAVAESIRRAGQSLAGAL